MVITRRLHRRPPVSIGVDFALLIDARIRQTLRLATSPAPDNTLKQQALLPSSGNMLFSSRCYAFRVLLALGFIKNERGGDGNVQRPYHTDTE